MTPLIRALIVREAGRHPRRDLCVLFALGLIAGGAATRFREAANSATGFSPVRLIVDYDAAVMLAALLAGGIRIFDRVARDQSSGWLAGWRGNGGDASAYGLALWSAVFVPLALAFLASVLPYALVQPLLGGMTTAMATLPRTASHQLAALACWFGFATLVAVIARDIPRSIGLAVVLIMAPVVLAVALVNVFEDGGMTLLSLHLPPRIETTTLIGLGARVLYISAIAGLLHVAAGRWMGRERI